MNSSHAGLTNTIRNGISKMQQTAFGVAYVCVVNPKTLESVLHSARGRVAVRDTTL